jgi:hypothetical protein
MAVIFPKKFIFLAHPRTGSVATSEALMRIAGTSYRTINHHVNFATLKRLKTIKTITVPTIKSRGVRHKLGDLWKYDDEITVSTIRDPFDVIATWFCLNPSLKQSMKKFLENYTHTYFKKRLFFHFPTDVVLNYWTLEADLRNLLSTQGILWTGFLDRPNPTKDKDPNYMSYFDAETKELAKKRFKVDFEIWRHHRVK